jgi:heat shock protein HslJ
MSKPSGILQLLAIPLALGLAGCGAQNDGASPPAEPPAPVTAAPAAAPVSEAAQTLPAPSWQEAANATYGGVFDEVTTMADGLWEGEPFVAGGASAPHAGLVDDFRLSGDLDGDGAEEAVVLLWSSSGGSGTFDYLAVLDRDAIGTVINRATAPLGDRVKVRAAAIEGGRVVVDAVQAGLDDAACCPGQKMRRTFVLEGEKMREASTEDQGRLSLADLEGEWKLLRFGPDEALPADVEITLEFADGAIAGKAACNRYTAGVVPGDMPGTLSLSGPMAMTRMMCPPPLMDWEQRYSAALEGLQQFSFVAGRLVLSWRGDDDAGTLTFIRAPAGAPGDQGL